MTIWVRILTPIITRRINHKETLAQVFTDIRYNRKDNEAMSKGLIAALIKQGFLPYTIEMGHF